MTSKEASLASGVEWNGTVHRRTSSIRHRETRSACLAELRLELFTDEKGVFNYSVP